MLSKQKYAQLKRKACALCEITSETHEAWLRRQTFLLIPSSCLHRRCVGNCEHENAMRSVLYLSYYKSHVLNNSLAETNWQLFPPRPTLKTCDAPPPPGILFYSFRTFSLHWNCSTTRRMEWKPHEIKEPHGTLRHCMEHFAIYRHYWVLSYQLLIFRVIAGVSSMTSAPIPSVKVSNHSLKQDKRTLHGNLQSRTFLLFVPVRCSVSHYPPSIISPPSHSFTEKKQATKFAISLRSPFLVREHL